MLSNQLEASKKTDMWPVKQILYLMSHTLPLRHSKAGQRLGHVNLHSILSMHEGRNPVVACTASIPASSAASWHSTTALPSEKQGWLPPAESQTAGLQLCAHLYWDEGLFSGAWRGYSSTSDPHKHSVSGWEGQFQQVTGQHFRPVQVLRAQ